MDGTLNRHLGVLVVPEIDIPGHAAAWGFSKQGLNLTVHCPSFRDNINNIPLDPSSEAVYDTVLEVLTV